MKVLIVDDSAALRALIKRILHQEGFAEVAEAASAEEMYDRIGLERPNVALLRPVDLILLDISLPGTNGIDACRRVKSDDRFRDLPIVMVTASNDKALLRQSFEAGASDYITKPCHPVELIARIRSVKRLKAEMARSREREEELLQVKRELEKANRELECLSCLDGLTGIFNRRRFDEDLQREWDRAQRNGQALSIVLVDIDCFKSYNDTYGHQLGDTCLTKVARELQATAKRSSDLVARYGGEEFAIILPNLDYDGAVRMGGLLKEAVVELHLDHRASHVMPFVTVSVGIATALPSADQKAKQLVGQADMALYQSKATGRNRVTHWRDILHASRSCAPTS